MFSLWDFVETCWRLLYVCSSAINRRMKCVGYGAQRRSELEFLVKKLRLGFSQNSWKLKFQRQCYRHQYYLFSQFPIGTIQRAFVRCERKKALITDLHQLGVFLLQCAAIKILKYRFHVGIVEAASTNTFIRATSKTEAGNRNALLNKYK